MSKTTPVLVCFLASLIAAPAFSQDWPGWRGANRDAKVTGFNAPANWPKTLTPKWKKQVGLGDSTPALVGDRLYVFAKEGAEDVTLCLNAADGQEIWRDKYPAANVTGPASRHDGPRSSPAVAEGKVVTVSASNVISCLNAADGKVAWRHDEIKGVPQFFASTSPIIVDGLAIAHLGGRGSGALVAYDLNTGSENWKWAGEGPGYSSAVLMTVDGVKQLVEEAEKSVVGVSAADGKLLWQLPFAGQRMAYNTATPIVEGSTVYFTGGGRGTHAIKISKEGEKFTATELWTNPQIATQFNTPVLKDGMLYGLSERGDLFCINAKDGKTAWTHNVGRSNFGAIVDAGSVVLALTDNSELIVLKPGDKFEEVARMKVADTQTYAYPVISGNRMYIKDKQDLAMYVLE